MRGFCPLASGSRGNCLYIGTERTKILVDAGIGVRTIERRLREIGVGIEEIDAVLISHEHTDHIRGVGQLVRKHRIPVLTNSDTAQMLLPSLREKDPHFALFLTGELFTFGDIAIHSFSIQHDTVDPVGFTFWVEGYKIGMCTDLGFVTTLVQCHLQGCDYLYIEANHEPAMVHACARSSVYKSRVLGRQGHLSNESCARLVKGVDHKGLKRIYLAHLSSECNRPELARGKVMEALGSHGVPIFIAHQERVSAHLSW